MRFRSKVREIEAEQWFDGKPVKGVHGGFPGQRRERVCYPEGAYDITGPSVVTIHGHVTPIAPGDWVAPESDGVHFYPIKPDEMALRYDPIDPPAVGHPEGVQLGGFAPAEPSDRPLPGFPPGSWPEERARYERSRPY
jgi:hypothetical protein